MRLGEAARVVRAGYAETLTYTGLPREHWGPHPHRQRHRAAEPRGPQANARGGHLPGREVGAHARHREARVRRGERVGLEALPGRDAVGGVAVPEAGLWAVGKCARILTVPRSRVVQVFPGAGFTLRLVGTVCAGRDEDCSSLLMCNKNRSE